MIYSKLSTLLITNLTIESLDSQSKYLQSDLQMTNSSLISHQIISENSNISIHGSVIQKSTSSALSFFDSNISVSNCIFDDNRAVKGGAINIQCSLLCSSILSNNSFLNNQASISGGALTYSSPRPLLVNNTFRNNSAPYGNDISSFPTKIKLSQTAIKA